MIKGFSCRQLHTATSLADVSVGLAVITKSIIKGGRVSTSGECHQERLACEEKTVLLHILESIQLGVRPYTQLHTNAISTCC